MNILITGFGSDNSELYKTSLNLRQEIFVKELGFNKHVEFDSLDENSIQFLIEVNEIPVGLCRIVENEKELIIDRFAILSQYRKKAIGSVFFKYILSEIIESKKSIIVYSNSSSKSFFNNNGFKKLLKTIEFDSKSIDVLIQENG